MTGVQTCVFRSARALGEAHASVDPTGLRGPWRSGLSRAEFEAAVREIIELERAGECYQANLTRTLTCAEPADPVALFDALDRHNPAPHAALLRAEDLAVVSASPERFLRLVGRNVETRPIKGTARDAADLLDSVKDRAENVMIVDLARNDLGRVVRFGTEQVEELMTLERFSHVMHLTSQVAGELAEGRTAVDVLRATFPAGTVSGAPKVRAMEIIDALEPTKRGPYAGVVGYLDFSGNLDTAIAIRTMFWRDGQAVLQAGAGIVADSVAADEDLECRNKARALLSAAAAAQRARR